MTQHQSDEKHEPVDNKMNTKSFANLWIGIFFLTSSVSLIIVMLMFIFVWQPIWTEGFRDFHTISNAIDKLNTTAQPAADTIPLMLKEMNKMNYSMNQMTIVISTEIPRMTYLMGRVDNKMPNMDFMP